MAKNPPMPQNKDKVEKVMKEFKAKTLKSGNPGPGKGKVVTNPKQAVAIALNEQRKKDAGKKK
jgi:hypothetical protein